MYQYNCPCKSRYTPCKLYCRKCNSLLSKCLNNLYCMILYTLYYTRFCNHLYMMSHSLPYKLFCSRPNMNLYIHRCSLNSYRPLRRHS